MFTFITKCFLLIGTKEFKFIGVVPDPHLRAKLCFLFVQVITAWINTCPEAATWKNLIEALTEMGQRKIAQEVAEKRGKIRIMAI